MRPLRPAVCVLVGIAWSYLAANSPLQKPAKTTQGFIAFLSAEAVQDADTESHVHLDYTVESIKKVADILRDLHGLKDHSSVAVDALALAYGA